MLEHLIQYTHSDKRYNEDVSAVGNDYMFVIDGATGLGANDVMGCGDDARWFAQTMKEHIQKHIHDELPLTEIVCQAIRDTRSRYRQDVEKMKKIDMPSGCIALFRLKDKKLEFFGLGDTCGVIELRDGQILMIADNSLRPSRINLLLKSGGRIRIKLIIALRSFFVNANTTAFFRHLSYNCQKFHTIFSFISG